MVEFLKLLCWGVVAVVIVLLCEQGYKMQREKQDHERQMAITQMYLLFSLRAR